MKVRFGLRAKFFCLFILCAGIILGVFNHQFDQFYEKSVMNKYVEIASSTASIASNMLEGDRIETYLLTERKDEQYEVVQQKLEDLKRSSAVNYLYVFRLTDEAMEYVYDIALPEENNTDVGEFCEGYPYDPAAYVTAFEVMDTKKVSKNLEVTQTVIGYLASAYAPVLNSKNEVVALVGVDINMNDIIAEKEQQSKSIMEFCGIVVAVCFLILLLIVQVSVIRPIRRLKKDVVKLADGKIGVQTKPSGKNEITDIAIVFNRMSKNIENHIRETEGLNQAYYKFVPSKIFEILHKNSVMDVKLGDGRNTRLSVLSLVTEEFDELTKTMGNEQMFQFMNDILYNCVPIIMEQHGVVERFEDAGLTAFFTESNQEVLDSAILILQRIAQLNVEKHFGIQNSVHLRCAITYDSVKLGIVGHEDRMSVVTISEQHWITKFLCQIAAEYNSNLLVTAAYASSIPDFAQKYDCRFLGFVHVAGSSQMEKIYDVFNGDDEENIILKKQTKGVFEEGVNLYCARKYSEARLSFVEVLRQYRRDTAASRYLYLCNQHEGKGNKESIDIAIETM